MTTTDITIDDAKMQERLSKVLRQAERADEGSPEREAFMEKAMRLAAAYSLDLDLARAQADAREKAEEPVEEQYQVGSISRGRKSSANNHMVDLMLAICGAYGMQSMISHSEVYVFAVGFPSDHKVVSRMYALLSVQMVAEADAALKRGDHKEIRRMPVTRTEEIPEEERAWGEDVNPGDWTDDKRYASEEAEVGLEDDYYSVNTGRWVNYRLQAPPKTRKVPVLDEHGQQIFEDREVSTVDGRVWRANFYQAFINRTRQRLVAARAKAMKAAGIDPEDTTSEKGLALADKSARVESAYEEKVRVVLETSGQKSLGTFEGGKVSHHDVGAYQAGDASARKARLGDENDIERG